MTRITKLEKQIKRRAFLSSRTLDNAIRFSYRDGFSSLLLRLLLNLFFSKEQSDYHFKKKKIVVLYPGFLISLASVIQSQLQKLGIDVELITETPTDGFSQDLHIVLCAQEFLLLPPNYIVFQLEQLSVAKRFNTDHYHSLLFNSLAIFEYSSENINYLVNLGIPKNKIFHTPIFSHCCDDSQKPYQYDILFYGSLNTRRKDILKELGQSLNIKIANKIFGTDMHDMIKRSKVILNIHYYDDAILESTRIAECLCLGKTVVSEKSVDQTDYDYLDDVVTFVDCGNIEKLKDSLTKKVLIENFSQAEKHLRECINSKFDRFGYSIARGLLSLGIISFEDFCELWVTPYPWDLGNCSSLDQNLSIKFLIRKAIKQNLKYLLILFKENCEIKVVIEHEKSIIRTNDYLFIPDNCFKQLI